MEPTSQVPVELAELNYREELLLILEALPGMQWHFIYQIEATRFVGCSLFVSCILSKNHKNILSQQPLHVAVTWSIACQLGTLSMLSELCGTCTYNFCFNKNSLNFL